MSPIIQSSLPQHALLSRYRDNAYTDCYYMDVAGHVDLSAYIASFYTSRVFKIERALLGLLVRKPASDRDVLALASGTASRFSAWSVEDRHTDQILLQDMLGRTRSWLMCAPLQDETVGTRLYFGSAVMSKTRPANGKPSFGFLFHFLSGFHRWYTKALMRAARAKLGKAVRHALPTV